MVSIEYSEAAVEVLDILKHTKKEVVEKIPKSFIKFLEDNCSKTYTCNFDHTKPIKDFKMKSQTQDILGIIYLKYWADENEKKEFRAKLKENEDKYKEMLEEKHDGNNIFKKIN